MTRQKRPNVNELKRLKDELREEILQEIAIAQTKSDPEKREIGLKKQVRSENTEHWMKVAFLASGLLLSWPIQYFFPELDFRIVMTIGIFIGVTVWLSAFVIRNYFPGQTFKAHPTRSTVILILLSCALAVLGFWTVSGRPARLIEVSRQDFVVGQNTFNKFTSDSTSFDVEPNGSLAIRCYDKDACDRYAKWVGEESTQNTLHDSIVKAGFERVVLYEDFGALNPGNESRIEMTLK